MAKQDRRFFSANEGLKQHEIRASDGKMLYAWGLTCREGLEWLKSGAAMWGIK